MNTDVLPLFSVDCPRFVASGGPMMMGSGPRVTMAGGGLRVDGLWVYIKF